MPLTEFVPRPADSPLIGPVTAPLEGGSGEVGLRHFQAVDTSREDPGTGQRRFMVSVFYPAENCGDSTRARLGDLLEPAPEAAVAALKAAGEEMVEFARGLELRAWRGAPLKTGGGRFPVLIYYPGGQAHRLSNVAVCEALAASGYMVFALEAPRDAPITVFPDGLVVTGPLGDDEDYIWPRVADVRFLLDALAELDSSGPFAGRLDLGRIGMFGASRGGYLSNICAVEDQRVRAAVNMDGFLWGLWCEGTGLDQYPAEFQEKARNLRTPILRLLGEQDPPEKHQAKFAEESRDFGGPFISAALKGFKHTSFGSVPYLCGQPEKWSKTPTLQAVDQEKLRLLVGILRDFFAVYLLDERKWMTLLDQSPEGVEVLAKGVR